MAEPRKTKVVPHAPAPYSEPEVRAIKALAQGVANEGQQKMALNWIITGAAGTYDQSFIPGEPDTTAFREGRRSVGLQVVKLINMPMAHRGEQKYG